MPNIIWIDVETTGIEARSLRAVLDHDGERVVLRICGILRIENCVALIHFALSIFGSGTVNNRPIKFTLKEEQIALGNHDFPPMGKKNRARVKVRLNAECDTGLLQGISSGDRWE